MQCLNLSLQACKWLSAGGTFVYVVGIGTGEMLVGPAKVMFMDEISTGLDSATTFQIVKFLRQTVHALDGTALVSLLQPAPEAFELFDDLILLSEGQIVYQGPRALVVSPHVCTSLPFQCHCKLKTKTTTLFFAFSVYNTNYELQH
jgi:ABC-type cobalamin/Fe3+-siderophores transport system ATPase subunit